MVVKIGGSLLDLPDLKARLEGFLLELKDKQIILVVGGGPAADLIRLRNQFDTISDEPAHWLAVRSLTFTSYVIESILPDCRVVATLDQCRAAWLRNQTPILDPYAFLQRDAETASPLPHNWDVTSDSIAARVARTAGAEELVLIKSVSWQGSDMAAAAEAGIVDRYLAHELAQPPPVRLRIVNLRSK